MTTEIPIRLEGDCDIRTVAEHREMFVDAFRARDEIAVDATRVDHIDIAFIQLLVSATKTAKSSRKRMRLIGVSEPLRVALGRAGLRLTPSDDQITWA